MRTTEDAVPTAPELLPARPVYTAINASRAKFYDMVRTGLFPQPAVRLGTRFTRWHRRDVEEWLADPQGWIARNASRRERQGVAA